MILIFFRILVESLLLRTHVSSHPSELERSTNGLYSLYSSHKGVLAELVEEARIHYLEASVSRVAIHMNDGVRFLHHP